MDRKEAADLVRRTGWLAQTADGFKDEVLMRCDLLSLAAGATAFRAGDNTGGVFAVVEGQFELHLSSHGPDPSLVHICGPGFWLGNTAAVTGGRRRMTAVAGVRGCQIFKLPAAEISRIVARDQGAWRYFAELHARNYLSALDVVEALKRSNPTARITATICNLLDGTTRGQKLLQVSQSDLASLTRLGRSKVNVVLNELERRGVVRRGYGYIEISNVAALRRLNVSV